MRQTHNEQEERQEEQYEDNYYAEHVDVDELTGRGLDDEILDL